MFSHSWSILDGAGLFVWLREALGQSEAPIFIGSAFVRTEAVATVLNQLPDAVGGDILVRWQLDDLVSGASDLDLFSYCENRGLSLHMRLDYHGKIYVIPGQGIGIGSANATAAGLGISTKSNYEVCTLLPYSERSAYVARLPLKGATVVTKRLVEAMDSCIQQLRTSSLGATQINWPDEVLREIAPEVTLAPLELDDCFFTDGQWLQNPTSVLSKDQVHDLKNLGFETVNIDFLGISLSQTKMFRWLISVLSTEPDNEAYFGRLAEVLHRDLQTHPSHRRQEVKWLLQNLLSWASLSRHAGVRIDRPSYSQRIKLDR